MADTLTVHLNRDGQQTLDAPERFETTGPFELVIHNHGTPAHVHLHLDDALAAVASFDATTHYVEPDAVRTVGATVADDFDTVTGALEVVTGYGAVASSVSVSLSEPPTVRVDDSLSRPREEGVDRGDRTRDSLPLLGGAVVAVVAIVLVVATVDETLALALGVLSVVAGGAAAAYLFASS